MTTKLNDLVRTPDGEVTTISALDDRGMIAFEAVERFAARASSKPRKAYFASMKGTLAGWEIGKMAYLSRTGQTVTL